MGEKFEIGDFGHARFLQEKKGFVTTIDCYGWVKQIEKRYILFEDCDGFPYLPERKDFQFAKCEFKIK